MVRFKRFWFFLLFAILYQTKANRAKLRLSNKKFFFSNFYERKLLNNETTLSYSTLANYYANMQIKETIQASPKWGRGVWEPLSHLLFINFYNVFLCFLPLPKEWGEKGKERRGKYFLSFCSLLASLLAFSLWVFLDFSKK